MNQERIQVLYEISLAIGRGETLAETADRAISAYLQKLNCSVGAVFEQVSTPEGTQYRVVETLPSNPRNDDVYQAGRSHLEELVQTEQPAGTMPVVGRTDDGSHYCLMELPKFGALLLGKHGGDLDEETITALAPLNEKLAEACHNRRIEAQLREERNRFETVIETIQEPVVNVVFQESAPIVQRVNAAFEETFGYTAEEATGRNLNELILPDSEEFREKAKELDEYGIRGEPVTKEVRRQTADGLGDFLFRAAPVDPDGSNEFFGMYIDITAEKRRQRKLERLYSEIEEILTADGKQAIAQRTIEATEKLLDPDTTGVHLYDRGTEALVPVAVNNGVKQLDGFPRTYTDTETIVWDVYESGEPTWIDDLETFDGPLPQEETPTRSAMLVPFGSHGIHIIASETPGAFDATDFQFVRLLSTLVEIALNRTAREEGLEAVQEITRATLEADSHEAVAERVLECMPEPLDLPLSGIWRYDSGTEALIPVGVTDEAREVLGDPPTFRENDGIPWTVYHEGETAIVDDASSRPDARDGNSSVGSELVTPLGEFGVLLTASANEASFSESERQLVEALASNLETVLRLVNRRKELELLDQVLARVLRHNIRNDLTVIQGFATSINDRCEGTEARNAERIIQRCERLETTAEHAREMREIVRSREENATVRLGIAVEHAVEAVESKYPETSIRTDIAARPTVVAHPDVTTAVRHLLENAVEYGSSEGAPVEVAIREQDGEILLEVTDDGPGIPDGELDILSQHGESSLKHGSGAGLWIIDRVVEYSDAVLEFENDDGTTARIRFSA